MSNHPLGGKIHIKINDHGNFKSRYFNQTYLNSDFWKFNVVESFYEPKMSQFWHSDGVSFTRSTWDLAPCMGVWAQLCLALCDPVECSRLGSSDHGISQARILEWVATPFSRGILPTQGSNPVSCVSCIGRWILTSAATWEAYVVSRLM